MTADRLKRFTALLVVVLLVGVARAQDAGEVEHEFAFKPAGSSAPQKVSVAGDFNNWSMDATPMTRGDDGVWRAKVKLPEGVQHYKFVVDGNQWLTDPAGDKSLETDDNYGGKNSGVMIGPDARHAPPPKANDIDRAFITFNPAAGDADVIDPHRARLRIRLRADDAQSVAVHFGPHDAGAVWKTQPMYKLGSRAGIDTFGCLIQTDAAAVGYVFKLRDGTAELTFAPQAAGQQSFDLVMTPTFTTPDWAKRAVWYQIFPERFRNGDATNDPNDHPEYERLVPWTGNWWKSQPGEAAGDDNFYKGQGNVWKRRYGGDVQGLVQALPYLKRLGVNAIYLNPVFEAESMHKYDTSDYRHIDDNFGYKGDIAQLQGETDDPATWQWTKTDKLFLDFVAQAHAQGFQVILDGVFNHVGKGHPFFQDVLKNGKNSKYADWFEITDFNSKPIKYKSWDGDGHLPVFRKDAARGLADGPRQHVLAITKRWLAPDGDKSKGVDGWRLDVPGDIPHPFWVEFRQVVKSTNPDAYITGEIWPWAQPWLKGDQFDAVMNYRWADAAQKFFVNQKNAMPPSGFNAYLNDIAFNYPFQVALVQQNLFDSHDTDRLASMFVNPDLDYDAANRIQDNGPKYKRDKPTPQMYTRMRQAVAAQMGFVGAPMIYYGDEAGMWSPDDPSNRMPMVWPEMKFDDPQVKFDDKQFGFYQRAIAARRQLEPLQLGFFHATVIDDARGTYAFQRDLGDRHAYVVINRSDRDRTIKVPSTDADGTPLVNWLDPRQAEMINADGGAAARPLLKLKPGAKLIDVTGGAFSVTLKPFESAILSAKPE
jgi:glycosidase